MKPYAMIAWVCNAHSISTTTPTQESRKLGALIGAGQAAPTRCASPEVGNRTWRHCVVKLGNIHPSFHHACLCKEFCCTLPSYCPSLCCSLNYKQSPAQTARRDFCIPVKLIFAFASTCRLHFNCWFCIIFIIYFY